MYGDGQVCSPLVRTCMLYLAPCPVMRISTFYWVAMARALRPPPRLVKRWRSRSQVIALFGCNGTGFKTAPAVGKALAEQITGVSEPEIPITSLRPARYFEQATILDTYGYADRPQEHTEPPQ